MWAAAAESLPPAEAAEWARQLVQSITDAGPVPDRRPRLFFCGSAQDQDSVYRAIEEHGIQVVGEDHDWGMVAPPGPVVDLANAGFEDLLGQLAQMYHYRSPAAATAPLEVHARWSASQAVDCGAEAVLCMTRVFDDAPAWDYPKIVEYLHGVPSALLSRQPIEPAPAVLQEALAPLLNSISPGRRA